MPSLDRQKYKVWRDNLSAEGEVMEDSVEQSSFKAEPSTTVGSGHSLKVTLDDSREMELEAVRLLVLDDSGYIPITMTTTLQFIASQNLKPGPPQFKLIGFVNVDEDLWVKQEWTIILDCE